ncbi:MAG: hypothetical protein ACAI35_20450 [Candidatus Methylacidiphilales bacterium]|nr:hypothetical protein [Candidatus Methylacidiphilales bacterium]
MNAAASATTEPARKSCGGETEKHRQLKVLAARWAREAGYNIMAPEVSFPYGGFRADMAAYRPHFSVPAHLRSRNFGSPGDTPQDMGLTAIFECKQSRSDLMKDSHDRAKVQERLKTLVDRKTRLEELLKMHCPHLAQGESLFPEYDSYNWSSLGHKSHAFVLRKIREAQSALSFKTKFFKMFSYKLAHLHYLVMEPGIIKPHEAPVGWGLLVREGENTLRLEAAPARQEISPGMQLLFLQRIASTAGRGLLPFEEPGKSL